MNALLHEARGMLGEAAGQAITRYVPLVIQGHAWHVARFARRLGRALRGSCPQWLVWIWIAASCIPTPCEIDQVIPITLTLVLFIFQPRRILRAWSAGKGGKSHRSSY